MPFLALLFFSLYSSVLPAQSNIQISKFNEEALSGWEEKEFKNRTNYQLVKDHEQTVLKAITNQSASGLVKKQTINLKKTPYLNWSWKVENKINNNKEKIKAGDDYRARLYVVVSGGVFFWKTRALNYVWASGQPVNSIWDNAYAPNNAKMLAVRSADDEIKQWKTEKRNVYQDLKRIYDEEFDEIHAIAIMSDSDDFKQDGITFYKDIYFSAE